MRSASAIVVFVSLSFVSSMATAQAMAQSGASQDANPPLDTSGQTQPPATPEPPHNPTQEVAGEQARGPALDVGPAKLRIGGYLGVTGIYRSTNSGGGPGTNFATTPYVDTLQGSVSEFRLSAQSSRISIRVDAPFPEARFRNLSGYFEMDFSGATPGNIAVTSSSAGFRLRQGFAEVQYDDSLLLAVGQAFSLMTPPRQQLSIWPSDYELSQAVDTNYVAGLVWERVPQVRLTWRPNRVFNWALSVESPEQQIGEGVVTLPGCCGEDIAAQYNSGNQALSVPNLMPDFVTRVAFNPSPSVHLDFGGVLRVFRHTVAPYQEDSKEAGGGFSLNARVNPFAATRLLAQLATGDGLGRYVGGMAPDVAFRADGSIAAIRSTSWVLGLEQRVLPRVSAGGYYSGLDVDDVYFADGEDGFVGYGFPGSSNAANRRVAEITATASYLAVRTENRGSVQVNFQTSWLRRQPWSAGTGPDSAKAWLFFAQARYNLP
jgi:hypothetical protein